MVKQQFGFIKARYRGLTKNTGQVVTLFALANLWLARPRWLALAGVRGKQSDPGFVWLSAEAYLKLGPEGTGAGKALIKINNV
jgi:hypothetical protein